MSAAERLDQALPSRSARLRRRMQTETPLISVERARYYTRRWRELENSGLPPGVRAAEAMLHVFRNVRIHLDADEGIAGAWTEHFLGLPVDIERGLFNDVLATELDRPSMLRYRGSSMLRLLGYLWRANGPLGMLRTMRLNAALGDNPLDVGLKTLDKREINRFAIAPADAVELRRELLPYWQGRCMADLIQAEIKRSGLAGAAADFVQSVPVTPSKQALIVSLAASIATYQGHLVLDYRTPLEQGLLAMRERVSRELAALPASQAERRDFLRSLEIGLDGVITYAGRLIERVAQALESERDPLRRLELEQMHAACSRSPLHPARTFREALQGLWTVHTAVELAHITNVHSLGRLDQLLYPYYRADVQAGSITADQARELFEELLLKVMARNLRPESNILGKFYLRYEGSTPITIGGLTPAGADATNDLTYLLLEAAVRSRSVTSMVLRVHPETPEPLYLAAAEAWHSAGSNLSLMNDAVFAPALQRRGLSAEDSRDYAITGCTDALCPGKTGGMSFSGLLLCRVLDLALRNGDARTLAGAVRGVGPASGDPTEFESFEQLFEAFSVQADEMIRINVEASNLRDRVYAEHAPAPLISAFIQGCLESGRDVTAGGALYNLSGVNMINSPANVIDSLYAIKTLVFERRALTMAELLAATDADFEGPEHATAARLVSELEGRWGNAAAESDALAGRVMGRLFELTDKYRCYKGGPIAPFCNSMTSHTMDGRGSLATPDGRRAARPFASSCSPYNVEANGLTAVLKSVAAIDFKPLLGCAVNVRLHPSAIGREQAPRRKFAALLRAYFALGGAQIQPTVASAEQLRAAQLNPDAYRDLIVKVGGYSTYFVHLGREIQDEIIARTEHCPAC